MHRCQSYVPLPNSGAGVAQIIQVLVVDGEGDGFPSFVSGDLEDVDCVVIFVGPGRNLRWVAAIGLEDVSREIAEDDMFPHDKDGRTIVRGFPQLVLETVDLAKAEFCIDRQTAANGGGLDGGDRANVIVS